ncbi:MAG: hypothetical protein HQ523_05320 [Lentisphaerae bacterium]|nr:hypothetical protein [Lentisphaerota bacterium]
MFRILTVLALAMLMSSCRSFRSPPAALPPPILPPAPAPLAEPAPPAPLATDDVRISMTAPEGASSILITDGGEFIGQLEPGGVLQWDRPAGVVHLQAAPVSNGQAEVRLLVLLAPGERSIGFISRDDGSFDFEEPSSLLLSDVRAIPRLRTRARNLPRDAAVHFLSEHLFAAPVPARLRRGYADADQRIVMVDGEPTFTWTRYSAKRGGNGPPPHASEQHPLAGFVDADIKMGVTARVALRRHSKDVQPAQAFFRLNAAENLAAKLETLLSALMACGSDAAS